MVLGEIDAEAAGELGAELGTGGNGDIGQLPQDADELVEGHIQLGDGDKQVAAARRLLINARAIASKNPGFITPA